MKPDPLHKVTDFDISKKTKEMQNTKLQEQRVDNTSGHFIFRAENLTFSRGTPHDLSRFSGEQSEIEGTLRHARHDPANKGVLM